MRDRFVLITGGTGGLGSHVTALAVRKGARITVPYVSDREGDELKQNLGVGAVGSVTLVRGDFLDEDRVRTIVDGMPRIDALIHLVGGFAMGPTHDFDRETFERIHALNSTSTFLASKHALRRMRDHGYGRIVTVGARAALEPGPEQAAYAANKAGVVAWTRAIAAENRGTDITANCVLPGTIDTPANRHAMGDAHAARWVQPSALAEVICFLASEAAGELRGAAIPVYGST